MYFLLHELQMCHVGTKSRSLKEVFCPHVNPANNTKILIYHLVVDLKISVSKLLQETLITAIQIISQTLNKSTCNTGATLLDIKSNKVELVPIHKRSTSQISTLRLDLGEISSFVDGH